MKVLYYSPHPHLVLQSQTGYGTHMREMIAAFEAAGHEVLPTIMGRKQEETVSSTDGNERKRPSLKSKVKRLTPGIVWETAKDLALLRNDRQFQQQLLATARTFNPDIIYERASYLQCSGVRVARALGTPHVLEVNSPYVAERKIRHDARTMLERTANLAEGELLRQTTMAAAVSEALINYLSEKHAVEKNTFICTPNAINPDKVNVAEHTAVEMRKRYALEDCFVIGFVGSILKWHRVDLLIKAVHRLQREHPGIRALVVGQSPLLEELRTLVRDLEIADKVIFTGSVPHEEVFGHMAAMHVGVLPDNLWYQSPVKVFEYGAVGCAVIAPDNVTMRTTLQHGKEGLLVEASVDALTTALKTILLDRERRLRMAASFHKRVLAQYTWARNVERILERLESFTSDRAQATMTVSTP